MIQIITDSVASIPADVLADRDIEVASLFVSHQGVEHREATMDVDRFYAEIGGMIDDPPTSSQPSQHELEMLFERAAGAGKQVLGLFISQKFSGTFDGAIRAARTVKSRALDFKCTLVDTTTNCAEEGFAVLDACDQRDLGASLSDCAHAAISAMRSTRFLFVPESLSFLKAGGRIGKASALLGGLLQITPILTVANGEADTFAKVRTTKRALDKMAATLKEDIAAYGGLKRIVVHYIGDKAPALEWARSAIEPLVDRAVKVLPVSPVIGTHVGPAIGVAYECMESINGKLPDGTADLVFSID